MAQHNFPISIPVNLLQKFYNFPNLIENVNRDSTPAANEFATRTKTINVTAGTLNKNQPTRFIIIVIIIPPFHIFIRKIYHIHRISTHCICPRISPPDSHRTAFSEYLQVSSPEVCIRNRCS